MSLALALGLGLGSVATAGTSVAATSSASTSSTTTKQVVSSISSLNVRAGASTGSKRVGSLKGGSRVTGQKTGSWFKITSGPYAGRYVSNGYLVEVAKPGATTQRKVKTGTTLNVRSAATVASKRVGTLKAGTVITGQPVGSWFKITSGSYAGRYVSGAYLTTPSKSTTKPVTPPTTKPQPNTKKKKVGYVMADPTARGSYMNIRSSASTTSSIVGRVNGHQRVEGTPVGDGTWWKVSNGYIHSAGLTSTSNPPSINAKIPTSDMCMIPSAYYSHNGTKIGYGYTERTPRYIQCKALPNLIAMENAYKAARGKFAEIDNGYRPWAEQSYWYKLYAPLGVTVSAPGKSNHGYGLSIDFRANYGDGFTDFKKYGKGYNWLIENSGRFGFNNPYHHTKIKDDVHWNFVG